MTYGVVTICRNARATIARTIRSVLRQSPLPAQYVFVDGDSADDTVATIHAAVAEARADCSDVSRVDVQVLPQAGDGIPAAWNMGIAALTTEVVFLLNSDDWYEDGCAGAVLAQFENHPGAGVVVGPVRFRHPDGTKGGVVRHPKSTALFPVLMPVLHPSCFVRRSVYDQVGLFDLRYSISADYDFVYRCHQEGVVFQRLGEVVVNMQMGGLAGQSRALARRETYDIARRRAPSPVLPWLAYVVRTALGR